MIDDLKINALSWTYFSEAFLILYTWDSINMYFKKLIHCVLGEIKRHVHVLLWSMLDTLTPSAHMQCIHDILLTPQMENTSW